MLSQDLKNLSMFLETVDLEAKKYNGTVVLPSSTSEGLINVLSRLAKDAEALEAVAVPGHQRNTDFLGDNIVQLIPIKTKESGHDLVS